MENIVNLLLTPVFRSEYTLDVIHYKLLCCTLVDYYNKQINKAWREGRTG